jgi:hypothetical protein
VLSNPVGLFLVGKKNGEKLSGWLQIGQDSVSAPNCSGRLRAPHALFNRVPDRLVTAASERNEEQPVLSQSLLLQRSNVSHDCFRVGGG